MLFSIVTPSFRQTDWLKLCIASVRDQVQENAEQLKDQACANSSQQSTTSNPSTTVTVEHIIQDAGSPDIEEFARLAGADFYRDGKLIFRAESEIETHNGQPGKPTDASRYHLAIHCEPDSGMYDAINKGLAKAKGEICAWLNCDEQYLPETLAKVLEAFQAKSELLAGNAIIVEADGEYLCTRYATKPSRSYIAMHSLPLASCAMFFRRSLIAQKGYWLPTDYPTGADKAWFLGLLEGKVRIQTTPLCLSVFVETGSNLSLDSSKTNNERVRFVEAAGTVARLFAPYFQIAHILRKLIAWKVGPANFAYSIYTFSSPHQRFKFGPVKSSPFWQRKVIHPAAHPPSE